MAAPNFPNSPSLNDFFVANGRRWQWNGSAWQRIPDPEHKAYKVHKVIKVLKVVRVPLVLIHL